MATVWRQQLEKDVGGDLEFYPDEGAPASATVTLYSSGTSEIVSSTAATVDSYTATIDSGAQDALQLTVSSETDTPVVGRSYIVATAGGRRAEVRVIDYEAGTVTLDQPLPFTVTGGTIDGWRISYSVSSANAATEYRRAEARWVYVIDGTSYRASSRFDIVDRPARLHVTERDIEREWPEFGEYQSQRDGWRKHVEGAIGDVWAHFEEMEVEIDHVQEHRYLTRAIALWVVYRMTGRNRDSGWYADAVDATAQAARAVWIDEDGDLSTGEDETGRDEVGRQAILYATVSN